MSEAAVKAGRGLLRDFGEVDQLQISRKGPSNFVTMSDIKTEKTLVKELQKARPDFGFLLEEGGEIKGKDASLRWIIDPLDGTNNFIHAVPYWCISIAQEKIHSNGNREIIAAVIYDVLHNEMFTAEKHKGAFVNGRRLSVSNRDNMEMAMLVSGNPRISVQQGREQSLLAAMAKHGAIMRFFGATALDLAHLAAGRIDACWYYTMKPWDVAAGLLLVQEAGGIVSDLSGKPVTPYSENLIASNRALGASIQGMLTKAA
jgi:myo-inositol-1(or 4)-monophosphatase